MICHSRRMSRRQIHRTCPPNSSKRFKREQLETTDEAVQLETTDEAVQLETTDKPVQLETTDEAVGEVNSTLEEHQDIVSETVPDTLPDDHSYNSHCVCGPVCTCIGCADKQQHVNRFQNEVDELKEQIHGMMERKNSKNTRMTNKALQNDRKVKLYRCIASFASYLRAVYQG